MCARVAPKESTLPHKHKYDSIYLFLNEEGLVIRNEIAWKRPVIQRLQFGEVVYKAHRSCNMVHRVTNLSATEMMCMDVEILDLPPVPLGLGWTPPDHQLVYSADRFRCYKYSLAAGQTSEPCCYPCFSLSVVARGADLELTVQSGGGGAGGSSLSWRQKRMKGEVEWGEPTVPPPKSSGSGARSSVRNVGETDLLVYVILFAPVNFLDS